MFSLFTALTKVAFLTVFLVSVSSTLTSVKTGLASLVIMFIISSKEIFSLLINVLSILNVFDISVTILLKVALLKAKSNIIGSSVTIIKSNGYDV